MKKKLIILLILCLALAGGAFGLYMIETGPVSSEDKEVIVTVNQNETVSEVLLRMDKAGLVKNYTAARVYVKLHGPVLKANSYRLNKNMSLSKMFTIMSDGDQKYLVKNKLQIIEGSTIPTVADKVAKVTGTSKDDVLKKWSDEEYLKTLINDYWFITEDILNKDILYPLEGYFYPETYFLDDGPSIEDATKVMLDKMDKVLSNYKDNYSKSYSTHEFLTLCSIVEKESLFDADRPKIAGVFINRLNAGMALQSDITVNYALNRTGVDVTIQMTKTDSKYNTYKYTGLPVGPVGCVTEDTMKDVIDFEESDYFYFFAKEDGTVIYSKTYTEHQKAVEENKWY